MCRCPVCGGDHPPNLYVGNGNVIDHPCEDRVMHEEVLKEYKYSQTATVATIGQRLARVAGWVFVIVTGLMTFLTLGLMAPAYTHGEGLLWGFLTVFVGGFLLLVYLGIKFLSWLLTE